MSYQCSLCPKYLESERQLMRHRKLRHNDDDRQFSHNLRPPPPVNKLGKPGMSLLARVNQYQAAGQGELDRGMAALSGDGGQVANGTSIGTQSSSLGDRLRCRLTTLETLVGSLCLDNKSRNNLSNDVIEKLNDPNDGPGRVRAIGTGGIEGEPDGDKSAMGCGQSRFCAMPLEGKMAIRATENVALNLSLSSAYFGQMLKSIVRQTILDCGLNSIGSGGGGGGRGTLSDGIGFATSEADDARRTTGPSASGGGLVASFYGPTEASLDRPITGGAKVACHRDGEPSSPVAKVELAEGRSCAIGTDVFGSCPMSDAIDSRGASRDGQELMDLRSAKAAGSPMAVATNSSTALSGCLLARGGGVGGDESDGQAAASPPPTLTDGFGRPVASGWRHPPDGLAHETVDVGGGGGGFELERDLEGPSAPTCTMGATVSRVDDATVAANNDDDDASQTETGELACRQADELPSGKTAAGLAVVGLDDGGGAARKFRPSSEGGAGLPSDVNLVAYESNDRKLNSGHEFDQEMEQRQPGPSAASPAATLVEPKPSTDEQRIRPMAEVGNVSGEMSGQHRGAEGLVGPGWALASGVTGPTLKVESTETWRNPSAYRQANDGDDKSMRPEEAPREAKGQEEEEEVKLSVRLGKLKAGPDGRQDGRHYCLSSSPPAPSQLLDEPSSTLVGGAGGETPPSPGDDREDDGRGGTSDGVAAAAVAKRSPETGSEFGGEGSASAGGLREIAAVAMVEVEADREHVIDIKARPSPTVTRAGREQGRHNNNNNGKAEAREEYKGAVSRPGVGVGGGGSFAGPSKPIEGEDNVNLFRGSRGPPAPNGCSATAAAATTTDGSTGSITSSSTSTMSSWSLQRQQTFQEMGTRTVASSWIAATAASGPGGRIANMESPLPSSSLPLSSSSSTLTLNNNNNNNNSGSSSSEGDAIYCGPNSLRPDQISDNVETNISYAQQQHQQQQQSDKQQHQHPHRPQHRRDSWLAKPTSVAIVCDDDSGASVAPNGSKLELGLGANHDSVGLVPSSGGQQQQRAGSLDGSQVIEAVGKASGGATAATVRTRESGDDDDSRPSSRKLSARRGISAGDSTGSNNTDRDDAAPDTVPDLDPTQASEEAGEFELPLNSPAAGAASGSSLIDLAGYNDSDADSSQGSGASLAGGASDSRPKSENESGGAEPDSFSAARDGALALVLAAAAAERGQLEPMAAGRVSAVSQNFEGCLGGSDERKQRAAASNNSSSPNSSTLSGRPQEESTVSTRKCLPSHQVDGVGSSCDGNNGRPQHKQSIYLQSASGCSGSGSQDGGGGGSSQLLSAGVQPKSILKRPRQQQQQPRRNWPASSSDDDHDSSRTCDGTTTDGRWGESSVDDQHPVMAVGAPADPSTGAGLPLARGNQPIAAAGGSGGTGSDDAMDQAAPKATTRRRSLVRFSETHSILELSPTRSPA